MPGESFLPTLRERVAAIETWREEHKSQHSEKIQLQESSLNRKFILIVALIGIAAAVLGGVAGAIVSYILYRA